MEPEGAFPFSLACEQSVTCLNQMNPHESSGSHVGEYELYFLLRCCAW